MRLDNLSGSKDYTNALSINKDDLYNLSVRKKVAFLCRKLIADINTLNQCYKIIADDEKLSEFEAENSQILIVCEKLLLTVKTKENKTRIKLKDIDDSDIRLYVCALLSEIAEGILSLSGIISIRHIERELIYASEIILRQLIYMLPYKIN